MSRVLFGYLSRNYRKRTPAFAYGLDSQQGAAQNEAVASSLFLTTPVKYMMLSKNSMLIMRLDVPETVHAHFYLSIHSTTGAKNFLIRFGGRYKV